MCGIFGLVANAKFGLTKRSFDRSVRQLIKLSERRGRESAGLAIAADDQISVYKQATTPSAMLKSRKFSSFVETSSSSSSGGLADPIAAIGHTRLVTNGTQAIPENNQPILTEHFVGIHNGIVTNDRQILSHHARTRMPLVTESDSDTEVLYELIDKYYEQEGDLRRALVLSFEEIEGSASVSMLCNNMPVLALATNTGSLYYSCQEERGFFVFGSERFIVESFLRSQSPGGGETIPEVRQIEPLRGVLVSFDSVRAEEFVFQKPSTIPKDFNILSRNRTYEIIDKSQPQKELRRCARCVLPETYPYISFDERGVCNYCCDYENQTFQGKDALLAVLEKYRSKNGEPDCVLGFSGGRDSCYALHLLKKELGMKPIAYTYDWAMVTDQARRNQAKVTGKLGVELIIRAADIHRKRRYIRKNIYAWLKRPELGMVPLFMAGDKLFYYYGRQLRKETGINLTIFGAGQQFEQMEFKTGFCGVDQKLRNNTKLYHFDLINKTRLALWYTKQYVLNPSYFNESLFDSIFAFYASFLNKDDYLYLYTYIPWEEKVIERTLKEEYGWETDEKYGENQWRMGDGHTAFIDYIYHTVAGFSEFDVFRSHQVRQGIFSRDEAIELIKKDNKPRVKMLQEFGQLIGFNLEEVLLEINAIPKLY